MRDQRRLEAKTRFIQRAKGGKIHVTRSRFVLVLDLIGREEGPNFSEPTTEHSEAAKPKHFRIIFDKTESRSIHAFIK